MLGLREDVRSVIRCDWEIGAEQLGEIQETVRLFPASGSYKTDAFLKLLRKLAANGCLELPPKRAISPQSHSPIAF